MRSFSLLLILKPKTPVAGRFMFVSGPILIPASLKKNFDVELKLILLANYTDDIPVSASIVFTTNLLVI